MALTKISGSVIQQDNFSVGVVTASNVAIGTNVTINSSGINVTGVVTAGSVTANSLSVSGNVSIAGTLTYEDVTNVDSIGIITARSHVLVGGNLNVTGVTTASGFSGPLTGNVTGTATTATALSGTPNLNVGVVTATSYYGDASNLTGIPAGLGTALSQDQSSSLNQLYYTNTVLSVDSTITVNPPDSSNIAYTQYAEIAVEEGYDLIVEDGDDLVPDILGLSTETAGLLSGAGGRVRADQFTNKAGTGAPTFPNGVNVTGVVTATSFSGNLNGNVIATGVNVTGVVTATSLSGNLNGNVIATGVSTMRTILPQSNNSYDLGSSSVRWANIYSNDLQLSNEGSVNDIDGTWGNYTIQEGENDLFLINRRNGKKYKFVLEEVN